MLIDFYFILNLYGEKIVKDVFINKIVKFLISKCLWDIRTVFLHNGLIFKTGLKMIKKIHQRYNLNSMCREFYFCYASNHFYIELSAKSSLE
jgi:hypothetical protein